MTIDTTRAFFYRPWLFLGGVAHLAQLPINPVPEIAFAGRSNVGKSSLINAIANNSSVARTSGQPGRTQQLNFFQLGDKKLNIVDMPGYGYAQACVS
jgi:Predicted GTPase